jgi:hypothetical protein
MTTPPKPAPSTQAPAAETGDISWLECRSLETSLVQVTSLAADLGGHVTLLDGASGFSVVQARLPESAVAQFKGALALAGASFAPRAEGQETGVLIFILPTEASGV